MRGIPEWAIKTKADELWRDEGGWFDWSEHDKIISFAENMFRPVYVEGDFKLLKWQKRWLSTLIACRNKDGSRRFKTANLHIAKKQGKTLLVSILAAYELLASGRQSPFVISASVSKDNAAQIYSEVKNTFVKLGLVAAGNVRVTDNTKKITIPEFNAQFSSLASDGSRHQGYNASLVLLDEVHAMTNSSLVDSLRYAHSNRGGQQVWISTSGDNPAHFYYKIYQKSKNVIAGIDVDTTHFATVFESEKDAPADDIHSETCRSEWRKANPSLGKTGYSERDFALELQASRADVIEWARFQRYRLNRWVSPLENAYFDLQKWDEGERQIDLESLKKLPVFLGFDGSMTTDPTSIGAIYCLGNREYYCQGWTYVAREGVKLRERTSLPKYTDFERQEAETARQTRQDRKFTITSGDMIDDHLILSKFKELISNNRVMSVTFDQTSAMIMMGHVRSEGVTVHTMNQGHKSMSPALKEFHRAIQDGRVYHDGSNYMRNCLASARANTNTWGEVRLHSERSVDHFDLVQACVMAFGQAMLTEVDSTPSITSI